MGAPCESWTKEQWAKCHELTSRGLFSHILTKPQKQLYNMWKTNPEAGEYGLYCSRKQGKSFGLLAIAYEILQTKTPGLNRAKIGRFVLPELKLAREVIYPLADELKQFIPKSRWPKVKVSRNTIEFYDGSKLILGGASPENLDGNRGPFADLIIGDEIAFWDVNKYEYAIQSVLLPQMTLTDGPFFMATTPPEDMAHPFIINTLPSLENHKTVVTADIYQNPMLTPEGIEKIARRYGGGDAEAGKKTKGFRREHGCELIPDNARLVIPEFDAPNPKKPEIESQHILYKDPYDRVNAINQKCHYVHYEGSDYGVGSQDWGGIVGLFFDHVNQEIIVTKEDLLVGKSITPYVEAFRRMNEDLYQHTDEIEEVVDMMEQTRRTCRDEHNFTPRRPIKGKTKDTVAILRNLFENNKIKVHKSCINLIAQLAKGMWKKTGNGEDFERSDLLGHLDLIMALAYAVRIVDWKRVPGVRNKDFNLGRKRIRK